jgi:hypothetical protein
VTELARWRREDLDAMPREVLAPGSAVKPAVLRVAAPGGDVIVKDVGHQRALRWLGRWLLARERRALERVAGLEGVPRLLATCGRDAFATDLIPGRPLDGDAVRVAPRAFADRLTEMADALHQRGVFHLDLHQRRNILVDDRGRIHLIDFGAAVAPGPIGRALLGWAFAMADRHAPAKYLARYAPESMSAEEARAIVKHAWLRKLWIFSPPPSERARRNARDRLRQDCV